MPPEADQDVPFEVLMLRKFDPRPIAPGLETATGIAMLGTAMYEYVTSEYMSHTWKSYSVKDSWEASKVLKAQQKAEKALPSGVEFKHQRLQDNAECFRLLKIEAVDKHGLIKCSVREFSFSERLSFVALSYVWSDKGPVSEMSRDFRKPDNDQLWPFNPSETRRIVCNDMPFTVSANLHAALSGLSDHLHGRYLWTDAICINQDDDSNDEKAVQVQSMDRIYGDAEDVFIWLGRKHRLRDIALGLVQSWPPYPDDVNKANISFRGKTYRTAKEFLDATATRSELMSWLYMMQAVSEGWFQRVWTLQEFILARNYAFYYDGKQIPTKAVKDAMSWAYFSCKMGPSTILPQWMNFQPSIFTLREQWHESNQRLDFTESVLLGGTRLATNPRDKVYALMAITDPESLQPTVQGGSTKLAVLSVDYTTPMPDLYVATALRLLHGAAGLTTLSLVNHPLPQKTYPKSPKRPIGNRLLDAHRGKSRGWTKESRSILRPEEDVFLPALTPDWASLTSTTAFPSWVPILAATLGSRPFFQRAQAGTSVFAAATALPPSFHTDASGRVLSVAAKHLDTVKTVANLAIATTAPHWTKFAQNAHRREFWNLVNPLLGATDKNEGSKTYAPTGEPAATALWRTLVTDIWNKRHPAPAHAEGFFRTWLHAATAPAGAVPNQRQDGDDDKEDRYGGMVFQIAVQDVGADRRLFVTEKGYVGLGPPTVGVGDAVVLVAGGYAPFALRRHKARGWLLVGEAYVHGVMQGEEVGGGEGFEGIEIL